jgi:hypothetical protein
MKLKLFILILFLAAMNVTAQNVALNWENEYNTKWFLYIEVEGTITKIDMDTTTHYLFDLASNLKAKTWVVSYPDSIRSDTLYLNYPQTFPVVTFVAIRKDTLWCLIQDEFDNSTIIVSDSSNQIVNYGTLKAQEVYRAYLQEENNIFNVTIRYGNKSQGYTIQKLNKPLVKLIP